ncbi:MAG: hypothetical protein AAEJ52_23120 [Myxococcota bacterium]
MASLRLCALIGVGLLAASCALSDAARRSSERLKRGWDIDSNGVKVMMTGPVSTLQAAVELTVYSVVRPDGPALEPNVKWFHLYESPMRSVDEIAILCHIEPATHIVTIRKMDQPIAVEARHELWHYPECIEVLGGEYELTVGYYSRNTVEKDLKAKTTTTESTKHSTTRWEAEPGSVYLLAAVIGKPVRAPGEAPAYRVRPRTKELWSYEYKLEVSHWKAAIVELAPDDQLLQRIAANRDQWQRHERALY